MIPETNDMAELEVFYDALNVDLQMTSMESLGDIAKALRETYQELKTTNAVEPNHLTRFSICGTTHFENLDQIFDEAKASNNDALWFIADAVKCNKPSKIGALLEYYRDTFPAECANA